MDFLDPRKKRNHKIRLIVGYFLMSMVIGLATVILVYGAYGYGINTKTGQIIQNGLLFVDSKPGGANITLNNKLQSGKTSARLVLAAGNYDLRIDKEGYRSWQRNFVLDEHTISRYVYPFLFPGKPLTIPLKNYPALPSIITESPDRRWLLVQSPDSTLGNLVFDQFDTSELAKPPEIITLPRSVVTPAESSTYKVVEWSTNNNHLLLEHSFPGGNEFIIFNRDEPATSFNINKLFKTDPSKVFLKNKKIDQFYLYSKEGGTVQIADTGQAKLGSAILRNVIAFKPYGNNIINYVTNVGAPAGKVAAKIWDDAKIYPLYTFNAGQNYLVDTAQFQGHWYYVAGSDTTDRVNIFKDPIDNIKNPQLAKALPLISLSQLGATKLSFSDNARFIGIQSGQNFAVYDLETKEDYQYTVNVPLTTSLEWMDGHRWIGQSNGQVFVSDYDNKNQQLLTSTIYEKGAFFSRDYNQMITLTPVNGSSGVALTRVDLRAGTDLPADRAQ